MNAPLSEAMLPFLATWVLKATLVLAIAAAAGQLLRRASAALRHAVWIAALGSVLALPVLSLALPGWHADLWSSTVPQDASFFSHDAAVEPYSPAAQITSMSQREGSTAISTANTKTVSGKTILLLVWVAGTLVLGLRSWLAHFALTRLLRSSFTPIADFRIETMAAECAERLGLQHPVTLVSGGQHGLMPMTWGFWRPVMLLPQAAEEWSDERLRAVILHEFAHVRRGDWLTLLLSQAACAVLWFHPLVWSAARALRLESEEAADDYVIRAGVRASTYSSDLLAIVQLSAQSVSKTKERNQCMTPAIPMAQPSTIERRIFALLDGKRRHQGLTKGALAATLSLATASVLPLAAVQLHGQEAPTAASPAIPAKANVDLSTAEAAVKSFIDALNRGDLASAAACVQGGRAEVSPTLAARIAAERPRFSASGFSTQIAGDNATVTIAESAIEGKTQPAKNEQISLRREGGAWRIVPLTAQSSPQPANVPLFLGIASTLTASDEQLSVMRQRAEQAQCINALKQLGLAAHMYATQHDGRFDFTSETAKQALLPFVQNNEKLFDCPTGKTRFAFNSKLAGRRLNEISNPSVTVLFYEASRDEAPANAATGVSFQHQGRANIAYVDGHVETIDPKGAAELRWEP